MISKEKAPSLPSLGETLKAGFDLTSKHLWLIILPVLLDSFFWVGPRLGVRPLLEAFLQMVLEQAAATGQTQSNIDAFTGAAEQLANSLNLFTNLTLPIIGVPTLMDGLAPEKTPLSPLVIELTNIWLVLLLFMLFTGAGILLSAIYYTLVAQVVRGEAFSLAWWWQQWPLTLLKLIGMLLLIGFIGLILAFPFLCLSLFTALFSPNLTLILWLVGGMPLMLLILYSFFAPHGILLQARPVLSAVRESFALVQSHAAATMQLFVVLYILTNGLSLLWQLADDGSWLTGVSILGHAFITTSLAAATFIFYRDRSPALTPITPEKSP
ncbi:MAG: hypothetical protein KJ063_01540 [Anaerolineae bacterium]|nr:hypothetical protein [Anaerolineae bacterium]